MIGPLLQWTMKMTMTMGRGDGRCCFRLSGTLGVSTYKSKRKRSEAVPYLFSAPSVRIRSITGALVSQLLGFFGSHLQISDCTYV